LAVSPRQGNRQASRPRRTALTFAVLRSISVEKSQAIATLPSFRGIGGVAPHHRRFGQIQSPAATTPRK